MPTPATDREAMKLAMRGDWEEVNLMEARAALHASERHQLFPWRLRDDGVPEPVPGDWILDMDIEEHDDGSRPDIPSAIPLRQLVWRSGRRCEECGGDGEAMLTGRHDIYLIQCPLCHGEGLTGQVDPLSPHRITTGLDGLIINDRGATNARKNP